MTRLRYFAPLIAAGAMLALTSGAQAQDPLEDGVMSPAADFPSPGTVINLPTDPNPMGAVGIPGAGSAPSQINMNAGFNFLTGFDPDVVNPGGQTGGPRNYFNTEVNILAENEDRTTFNNAGGVMNNCEIFVDGPDAFLGSITTIDADSTLFVINGEVRADSVIDGEAIITGGGVGRPTINGTVNISGGNIFGGSNFGPGGVVNATGNAIIFNPVMVQAGGTINIQDNANLGNATIGGVVNFTGGTNGFSYTVQNGGVINIMDGGIFQNGLTVVESGGTMNVTGGSLGSRTEVQSGGVVNISGGIVNTSNPTFSGLELADGATVNFTGTNFELNGTPIAVTPGMPSVVTDRTMVLTGTLCDGETFTFDLSANTVDPNNFLNVFPAGSTVTVNIMLLGDVNLDDDVNFLDIPAFIGVITGGGFQIEADINKDGAVDFLDIPLFIDLLT